MPRLTVVSSRFDAPLTSAPAEPAPPRSAPKLVQESQDPDSDTTLHDGPAIDLEQLETACMGLPALRASLLHAFLNDVSSRLERLTAAFESGDPHRVEFEAHGLKGMCATIGAGGCTMMFGEIEDLARDGHVDQARAILSDAVEEVHRTEQFIRRFDSILAREAA